MPYQTLKPIKDDPEEYAAAAKIILKEILKAVYFPLLEELGITKGKNKALQNAKEGLREAIESGRITYNGHRFSGRFNSTISKELRALGAKWDGRSQTWQIPLSKLPEDIQSAITLSKFTFEATLRRLTERVQNLTPDQIAAQIDLTKTFSQSIFKTESNFQKTISNLTVAPTVSKEAMKRIGEEYTKNLHTYVSSFLKDETKRLREAIAKSAFEGVRYENVVEEIKKSYGVTERKAQFLARQETNLLLAKYKEVRYQEIGIEKYQWRCVVGSAAHPVRPMHKIHDGKIFRWDKPPIVDELGNRKNPGEDYNCRCIAVPVVEVKSKT